MFRDLTVAVVIPAYHEADKIAQVVHSLPAWLDHIIVVDDASTDATAANARTTLGNDVRGNVLVHDINRGVGAAIVTGYKAALAKGAHIAVVMAGDGQMDPADLPALLWPIAEGRADYVKGNRFLHGDIWREMPTARIAGNALLSMATWVACGYRGFDSQCGYTAITRAALHAIDLDAVWPRYGYPNDLLARMHVAGLRVVTVPVRPVYGAAWRSGVTMRDAAVRIPGVLMRAWRVRPKAPHA